MGIRNGFLKFCIFILLVGFLGAANSCMSSKRRNTREKPDRRKIKPCDCPKFGQNSIFYLGTNQFS